MIFNRLCQPLSKILRSVKRIGAPAPIYNLAGKDPTPEIWTEPRDLPSAPATLRMWPAPLASIDVLGLVHNDTVGIAAFTLHLLDEPFPVSLAALALVLYLLLLSTCTHFFFLAI